MVWQTLEAKLSTPRMSRYLKGHQGNQDHAAQAYVHNMRIAESLVSIFHVLEVALRNAVQREMVREYQREDWFEEFDGSTNGDLASSYEKVTEARTSLRKRGVTANADDITAELSFGFWTSLFNRKAFPDVSKPLMRVFHHAPKNSKKADVIRSRLNNARDLRNRCFHHEPLLWQPIYELHRDITEIVQWIDPGLCAWLKAHDRLPSAVVDWNNWKEAARRAAAHPAPAKAAAATEPKAEANSEVGTKGQNAQVESSVKDGEKAPAAKPQNEPRHNKQVVKISVRVKADAQQNSSANLAPKREPAKVRRVGISPVNEAAKDPQPQPTGEAGALPVLRLKRNKSDD
ncbi:hypothetical protein PSH70_27750 [Pseudomonas fluorescens]|uniref:hypothetical protein n=2 Tax=Pseudomonas TaxID=286 RepID=UPI001FD09533|nr:MULTISPECIES: hypothetical protein [Pseudomonas]WLH73693.1 hypothetical protein PSH70_27750 [Pseudomonas fluorescens]